MMMMVMMITTNTLDDDDGYDDDEYDPEVCFCLLIYFISMLLCLLTVNPKKWV